jgi:hypothetical protein
VAIPDDLSALRGPTTGQVRLPLRVHSSGVGPAQVFDLGKETQRRELYELVLTEGTAEDVCTYLDLAELRRLWPSLWLPRHVRRAWQPRLEALAAEPEPGR